jgi:hypothetical protein
MFVVDLGSVRIEVGDVVVHLVVVDGTIEWITHWVVVKVLITRPHSWVEVLSWVVLLLVLVWHIRADNYVELVLVTTRSTLGQKESPGEAEVGIGWRHFELSVTIQSAKDLFVQLSVASAVVLVEVRLVGVTLDDVLSRFQLVLEVIELDKVEAVLADVDVSAVFVVFRSNINSDNGLLFFV